jgi:ribonuclease E
VNPFAPNYEKDALFSDDDDDNLEEVAAEPHAGEPEPEAAPAVDEVAAAEAEAAAAEEDRRRWRELLGELGLEAPPEPEPRSDTRPAADASAKRDLEAKRFGDRGPKKAPGAKRGASAPPVSAAPFGAGLFPQEEQAPRREAPAADVESVRDEAEVEVRETRKERVEAPVEAEREPEETGPKKRGRRRTRSWKRLHTAPEITEEEESEVMEGERELVEAAEEMGVADDLFGDVEEEVAAEADVETEEGEPSGDEERRPRRRRRRRTRRGEKPSREQAEAADEADESETEDEEDAAASVSEFADDLFLEDEDETEEREERPRRGRRRRPAAAEDEAAEIDEDEEEDELDSGGEPRPAHRKIPTWEDAVSVVVDLNLESRARSPGGGGRRRR